MVQFWAGLAVTVVVNLIGFAFMWGKFAERMDFMKGEIISLQSAAQTVGEREAMAEVFDVKFRAHEDKDDIRFNDLKSSIDSKLDRILSAISKRGA